MDKIKSIDDIKEWSDLDNVIFKKRGESMLMKFKFMGVDKNLAWAIVPGVVPKITPYNLEFNDQWRESVRSGYTSDIALFIKFLKKSYSVYRDMPPEEVIIERIRHIEQRFLDRKKNAL